MSTRLHPKRQSPAPSSSEPTSTAPASTSASPSATTSSEASTQPSAAPSSAAPSSAAPSTSMASSGASPTSASPTTTSQSSITTTSPTTTSPTTTSPTTTSPTTTSPTTTSPTTTSPTTTSPTTTSPTTTSPTTTSPTTTPTTTQQTTTQVTTTTQDPSTSTPTATTSSTDAPSRSTSVVVVTGSSTNTASTGGGSTNVVVATSTLQSTVFVTTTNSNGQTLTTAPSVITQTSTSTGSNGALSTVTQVVANPTLSPNNQNSKSAAFFRNKGAVAGVFVLVGLAIASIALFVIFAIRRRRRNQRIEHDSAVSATLAAAGFNRAPLDDDEERGPSTGPHTSKYGSSTGEMGQRSSSGLAIGTGSGVILPEVQRTPDSYWDINDPHQGQGGPPDGDGGFNPYADYIAAGPGRNGYVPTRTQSPPPDGHRYNDSADERSGHAATPSAGSIEPLLAGYNARAAASPPPPPPRNPARVSSDGKRPGIVVHPSSGTSSESTGDDRLDPGLRQQRQGDEGSIHSNLRDDADYSRPVLGVRNLPDGHSAVSVNTT